jgi:hypothetical protein
VVALDRGGQPVRQAPSPRQDAADQRMVDAQLEPLAVDALLRRPGLPVDLGRIAGVGVREDELADVVQERRAEQLVAVLIVDLARQAVSGRLGGDRVQAEALRHQVPAGGALEEVEGGRAGGERLDALGREHVDGRRDGGDLAALSLRRAVGNAQHRDHERDVGLDRLDDLADGGLLLPDHAQHAIARLRERGEGLERLEGRGQPASVPLVVTAGKAVGRPSRCRHRCFHGRYSRYRQLSNNC